MKLFTSQFNLISHFQSFFGVLRDGIVFVIVEVEIDDAKFKFENDSILFL